VNAALPAGAIVVLVRARELPEAPPPLVLPEAYAKRNPEDAAFCGSCLARGTLADERLVVDATTRGVKDVAVSLRSIAEGPRPPLARATLDNACCRFEPHVGFAPVGAPVTVSNGDPVSHAVVFTTLGGTQTWMTTIPAGAKTDSPPLEAPGILLATCPIHTWMQAWIIGVRHPYVAVTDAGGAARIDQVPAGTHEVVFWHAALGRASRTVVVEPGEDAHAGLTDADLVK
jgi:hypothetical protein